MLERETVCDSRLQATGRQAYEASLPSDDYEDMAEELPMRVCTRLPLRVGPCAWLDGAGVSSTPLILLIGICSLIASHTQQQSSVRNGQTLNTRGLSKQWASLAETGRKSRVSAYSRLA